ncbi:MAG TPA: hypothetical protein PKL14_06970 [Holophaga sp.]|jgi:hypothetical protein|nr:hypothetical protein [Holophaga sp.]
MPLAIIQASSLSSAQKQRIGEQILNAFHREGVPASSVVVLFKRDEADILLEGGVLIEAPTPALPVAPSVIAPSIPQPASASISQSIAPASPSSDFKTRPRRTKSELHDLKAGLIKLLQLQGAVSSFTAQEELGLKDCDWAPATLRRMFSELEDEGSIVKQGQKRGTRYVWKGITSQPVSGAPKLVKRVEEGEGEAIETEE